jgi:hypothetical protein
LELANLLKQQLGKVLLPEDFDETQAVWRECLAFSELARTIASQGHGGTVLIVPDKDGAWINSLSFPYQLSAPDSRIPDVIREEIRVTRGHAKMVQQLLQSGELDDDAQRLVMGSSFAPVSGATSSSVRATAALASVDGAVVMTRDLRTLGFGAKITVSGDPPKVWMISPGFESQGVVESPLEAVGGTRHQSAVRFVEAHRETLALIVSQDRHISVAHWHEPVKMVVVVRDPQWWV